MKKKFILYISGIIISLVILLLLFKLLSGNKINSEIPVISDFSVLPQPVREQISEAYEQARRKPSATNLGLLGMVYHSSASYELAAGCYKLAIQKGKKEWIWNYYLGYLSMEMGQTEDVVANFNLVLEKNPAMSLVWYYLGEAYQSAGNIEMAEKSFEKITGFKKKIAAPGETRADNFALGTYALFQLSRIFSDSGRNELAEKALNEVIGNDRSFGPAYRQLGYLYNQKGDLKSGKWYSDRAKDLLAFSPPVDTLVDRLVLISRSDRYLLKKIDEADNGIYSEWALKLVNHGMQFLPGNNYMLSKAIKIYLWNGLPDKASELTDKHISLFKDDFSELNKTGMLFFSNGLYQQAIQYLGPATELKPEDVEARKNLAISYYGMGDKQKSHDILKRLYDDNKNNPAVLADVAYLMFHLGEREGAMANMAKLKQVVPSNPILLRLSAEMAESAGDLQKAISLYESSFKGDPTDIKTVRYFGNLLVRQNSWGKAIKLYSDALEFNPNEPEFLERMGTLLITCPDPTLRNIEEGKEYSERAFVHISSRPNILVSAGRNLAYSYATLGDKQNALSTIRQTINMARRENVSKNIQTELENFYNKLQNAAL